MLISEAVPLRPTPFAAALRPAVALFITLAAAGIADRASAAPSVPATTSQSAPDARRAWQIAPGTLDAVLNRFANAAGIELVVDASLTQGRQSTGIDGEYTLTRGESNW